ncbi:MAG: ACP S-malonyltransferase [Hyphomicrobiaceae bacterium]|nr:ACP S-malonyltransferase [Hyphomicrobiaceae bacterium]
MSNAFTFPGQGSQKVGMGHELAEQFPAAKAVFDEVDDAVGKKLSQIMWEGSAEDLTMTQNAQPALMAVSMAVMRVLEQEKGFELAASAKFIAGHSLGEYSALAAGGAISLTDTAKLLQTRGRAMQQAVPVGEGAMAAILGLDFDPVMAIAIEAAQGDVCTAANDNAPGQVVVSGTKAAVQRAMTLASEKGARRAMLLPVSAPFHCQMMSPAAEAMQEALANVTINEPAVPLIANVLATPITSPDDIRQRLVEQVTGTVRWRESVVFMAQNGIETLYEVGAGKVLSGLARRIERSLETNAIGTPEDIESFSI